MNPRLPQVLAIAVSLSLGLCGTALAQGRSNAKTWLKTLRDPKAQVRVVAAKQLGAHAQSLPKALRAEVIKGLSKGLRDKSWSVRRECSRSLAAFGPLARSCRQALMYASVDRDKDVRAAAKHALGRLGPPQTDELKLYVEHLDDSRWSLRAYSARQIGRLGSKARGALPALLDRLSDSDTDVRREVGVAIGLVGVDTRHIPALVKRLRSSSWLHRHKALELLIQIGPKARSTLPKVLPLIRDSDNDVRLTARRCLARFGVRGQDKALYCSKLSSSSWVIRLYCVEALGRLGAEARDCFAKVFPLLKDSDRDVRRAASSTLEQIGVDMSCYPVLLKKLRDRSWVIRVRALNYLGRLGPRAERALPEVAKRLGDSDRDVRAAAQAALKRIQAPAPKVTPALRLPDLIKTLADGDAQARAQAAEKFGLLGDKAKSAVPVLIRALADDDKTVRVKLQESLEEIGYGLENLTWALRSRHWRPRLWAALVLGDWGVKARDAEPALRKRLAVETNKHVRAALAQALKQFRARLY